jgi:hypothetical protein
VAGTARTTGRNDKRNAVRPNPVGSKNSAESQIVAGQRASVGSGGENSAQSPPVIKATEARESTEVRTDRNVKCRGWLRQFNNLLGGAAIIVANKSKRPGLVSSLGQTTLP